jgi:hypothetical protein
MVLLLLLMVVVLLLHQVKTGNSVQSDLSASASTLSQTPFAKCMTCTLLSCTMHTILLCPMWDAHDGMHSFSFTICQLG